MKERETAVNTEAPWRRREGETRRRYRAFVRYIKQGEDGGKRSIRRASEEAGISVSAGLKASAKFEWVRRAQAFDAHVERLTAAEVEASRRRQARLEQSALEKMLRLADKDLDRLLELMSKRRKFVIPARDLTALLTAGINLSRVGRGEVEHRVETSVDEVRAQIKRAIDRYAAGEPAEEPQP